MKTGERCAEYLGCVPAIVLAGVAEGYKGARDTQKQSGPGAARAMGLSPAAGRGVCVGGAGGQPAALMPARPELLCPPRIRTEGQLLCSEGGQAREVEGSGLRSVFVLQQVSARGSRPGSGERGACRSPSSCPVSSGARARPGLFSRPQRDC